jgi:hypothetical protein
MPVVLYRADASATAPTTSGPFRCQAARQSPFGRARFTTEKNLLRQIAPGIHLDCWRSAGPQRGVLAPLTAPARGCRKIGLADE